MNELEVLRTEEFDLWLSKQPPKTRAIILARLDMLSPGHFGNYKCFAGLIELRWKNGTRVYSFMWGKAIVIALNGGNKNGQSRDIKKAQKIKSEILNGSRPLHQQ